MIYNSRAAVEYRAAGQQVGVSRVAREIQNRPRLVERSGPDFWHASVLVLKRSYRQQGRYRPVPRETLAGVMFKRLSVRFQLADLPQVRKLLRAPVHNFTCG